MKVLIVEDDGLKCANIQRELKKYGESTICHKKSLEDAKEKIEESCKENEMFDLIVTDMRFPDSQGESNLPDAGLQLIDFVNSLNLHIPMIICSSGRYRVNKDNLLGCLHYSEHVDWETEFRKLLSTIPSPPKQ